MAYSNWKNPFEEDEESPSMWEGLQQTMQTAGQNFGQSMGVFWKDMTNGSLKRGLKEQGNLLASAYKGPQLPQAPQPVKPNYNPGGYSQDTLKVMAKADRMYQQATTGFNRIMPPAINKYGLMGSYVPKPYDPKSKTFPGMVVPNTNARYNRNPPIYTYGLMGSVVGPDLNNLDSIRRWLASESLKYGSQGTIFPGMTIPQSRAVLVDPGSDPPPPPPDGGGGYGGYYSYGGGGGGSYKPAPKPWYMSLTNWRI